MLKTVAAFLNSAHGGTLLIGVADDGTVHGLHSDYVTLHNAGQDDRDRFQQHLARIVANAVGTAAATKVRARIHHVDGRDVCRVQVDPSGSPVDATVTVVKKGQHEKQTNFYVRIGNGTEALDEDERETYVAGRWPG